MKNGEKERKGTVSFLFLRREEYMIIGAKIEEDN